MATARRSPKTENTNAQLRPDTEEDREAKRAKLSPEAAAAARRLPPGPCLVLLRTAHGGARVALPARRLRRDDGVRLALRAQAGLEFRPAAIAHALRAQLG